MKHPIKPTLALRGAAGKYVPPEPIKPFGDSDQVQSGTREPTSFAAMQKAAAGDDYVEIPPCYPSGFKMVQTK